MGALVVTALIAVVCIIACHYMSQNHTDKEAVAVMSALMGGVALLSAASFIVLAFVAIQQNLTATGHLYRCQEQYKGIIREIETDSYRDKLGLQDKEIIKRVSSWNQDVIAGRYYSDNFWTNIYYPKKIYYGVEPIDYDLIKERDPDYYKEQVIIDKASIESLTE